MVLIFQSITYSLEGNNDNSSYIMKNLKKKAIKLIIIGDGSE